MNAPERFRCPIYACTLSVQACVARQDAMQRGDRLGDRRSATVGFLACRDCTLGREIAAKVAEPVGE